MTDYAFGLRADPPIALRHIGHEQEPLLIVDSLLEQPETLVDYAARKVAFTPFDNPDGYPGLRAPAPLNYVNTVVRALAPVMEQAFDLSGAKLARAECRLSMVTLRPDRLTPLQRIPHFDTADPLQFALLHYLCRPEDGGTAFYRHRATGYETMRPDRWDRYRTIRDAELRSGAMAPAYLAGDSEFYERTGSVDAVLDRVLIYRSRLLHSGMIPPDASLSDDPRRGRLTSNIFVNFRRA